jgi:hypothetical protein
VVGYLLLNIILLQLGSQPDRSILNLFYDESASKDVQMPVVHWLKSTAAGYNVQTLLNVKELYAPF